MPVQFGKYSITVPRAYQTDLEAIRTEIANRNLKNDRVTANMQTGQDTVSLQVEHSEPEFEPACASAAIDTLALTSNIPTQEIQFAYQLDDRADLDTTTQMMTLSHFLDGLK